MSTLLVYCTPMSSQAALPSSGDRPASITNALLTWGFLILLAAMAILALHPPDPVPASAPPQEFSAERAMSHVRVIARRPHPIGTPANASVRQYLLEQLSTLGMEPKVFSGTGVDVAFSLVIAGSVQDILGRIPGTANTRAVLLLAHYDSVYRAPGAGDDGAGVAAILETLRALRASSPLKNDLIVMFSDGEEAGLLGAESFVASHPWMKDIGLVMNFEGRGNQGPSLLFETSDGNRPLIGSVQEVTSYPAGSSLAYALYKTLPNDTDLTVFRPSGVPALNFAFGNNLDAYHAPLDTPENLSQSSLQHHGSYALALTRHFGQADMNALRAKHGDSIFFDSFGTMLVSYPESWALPLQIFATLLLVLAIGLSVRRGKARLGRLLLALLPALALLAAISGVLAAVWMGLEAVLRTRRPTGDSMGNSLLLIGLSLLGCAIGGCIFSFLRKRFETDEMSLAGLILLCAVTWGMTIALPAGSYLLFWPLLVLILGSVVANLGSGSPNLTFWCGVPGAAAMVLLCAPLLYLVYVFIGLGTILVVVTAVLIGLFLVSAGTVLDIAMPQGRWRAVAIPLLLASIACLAIGAGMSHWSAEHPRPDSLIYGFNADDHSTTWISSNSTLDAWTSQFFPASATKHEAPSECFSGYLYFRRNGPVYTTTAPLVSLEAPFVETKSDEVQGDARKVHLMVTSKRGADVMELVFDRQTYITSATINGRSVPLDRGKRRSETAKPGRILLNGMGSTPVDLDLTLHGASGGGFHILDESFGLPLVPAPRPADLMPWYGSDVTVVCQNHKL